MALLLIVHSGSIVDGVLIKSLSEYYICAE